MTSLCNSLPVLDARVHLPLEGVWHADFTIQADAVNPVLGAIAASLVDGAIALLGTTLRADMWRGVAHARVVGGAHGLVKGVPARSYRSIPARTILRDILDLAGEKLSDTSDPVALGTVIPAWTRFASAAGVALAAVVQMLGATWRMLPNGTIWVGTDRWPASTLKDYQVVDQHPVTGTMLIASDSPSLLPGVVFQGQRVGRVTHLISFEKTRTEIQFL